MAKPNQNPKPPPKPELKVSYQDVATALLKAAGIRQGYWRVALTFASPIGVNAAINGRLLPAAFLPVLGISLVCDAEPNDLSVDAAVVNSRLVPAGDVLKEFAAVQGATKTIQ